MAYNYKIEEDINIEEITFSCISPKINSSEGELSLSLNTIHSPLTPHTKQLLNSLGVDYIE